MHNIFLAISFFCFLGITIIPANYAMSFWYNSIFKLAWVATSLFALITFTYKKRTKYICTRNYTKTSSVTTSFAYVDSLSKPTGNHWTYNLLIIFILCIFTSTILSELSFISWFCLMPILSSIALGYLCYFCLINAQNKNLALLNIARALGISFFVIYLCSIFLFIASTPQYYNLQYAIENLFKNTIGAPTNFLNIFKGTNIFPFTHSSYTAGFCVLSIPISIGLIFGDKNRLLKLFWIITLVLGLIVLRTAKSRGGDLAFAFSIIMCVLIMLKHLNISWEKVILATLIFAIVTLPFLCLNNELRHTIVNEFLKLNILNLENTRVIFFKTGIAMTLAKPLLGYGMGMTPLMYPKFWNEDSIRNTFQLHSTPMQLLVDFGIIGTLTLAIIIITTVIYWYKLFQSKDINSTTKALLSGCFLSIISYWAFSLTDYQMPLYVISATLAISIGCIIGMYNLHFCKKKIYIVNKISQLNRLFGKFVLIPIFTIASFFQFTDFMARNHFRKGIAAFYNNYKINIAESQIKKALWWNPKEFGFLNHLANMLHKEAMWADNITKLALEERAISYLEQSAQLHPYQTYAHDALGWLYLDKDPKKSEENFKKAIYFSILNKGSFLGLGLSLLKQEKLQKAISILALEFVFYPHTQFSEKGRSILIDYPTILEEANKHYENFRKHKFARYSAKKVHFQKDYQPSKYSKVFTYYKHFNIIRHNIDAPIPPGMYVLNFDKSKLPLPIDSTEYYLPGKAIRKILKELI